jgi:Tol biopolymer transport system component
MSRTMSALRFVLIRRTNRRLVGAAAAAATAFAMIAAPAASAATAADFSTLTDFAISPDGTTLAFAGTLNGVPGLYESDGTGADVTRVVAEGPNFNGFVHPSFSPNGKTIAFSAFGKPGGGDVYTISAAGGKAKDLTKTSTIDEENPSYSPDGSEIVAPGANANADDDTVTDLDTVNAKTGAETEVLDNYPNGVGAPSSLGRRGEHPLLRERRRG